MFNDEEALKLEIKNAENLHGHLGPFLVIGVKMARLAKKTLSVGNAKNRDMQITAKLPLATPFSCLLDGIQATTQCTVGNQKLKVENQKEGITATFKIKNQNKPLTIHVNPQVIEMLKEQLSKGKPNEDLAWKIAATPEKHLFIVEKR
jgi:formylmethanofuran dehydrogenase subunit E